MRKELLLSAVFLLILTMLFSFSVQSDTGGKKATISDFPHLENFSDVDPPELPAGWSKIVSHPDNTSVRVETTISGSPVSEPNQVRLDNDDHEDAVVMLVSPPVDNLDNVRVSFYARANLITSLPDLVIGTMGDPADQGTFLPFDTIAGGDDLTNSFDQYHVTFDSSVGDNAHLVFQHAGTPSGLRTIYIDDILLMEAPTGPVMLVEPTSWDFGKLAMGDVSDEATFEISNVGIGELVLSPEDISLTGPDADRFLLDNLDQTVELGAFESTAISLAFAPEGPGQKNATLNILDMEIPLTGESVDPAITEFPHFEDFNKTSSPDLPLGWSAIVDNPDHSNATVETTTTGSPVSEPQHARIFSNSYEHQNVMLITPPTVNLEEKRIRFWARCNTSTNIPDLIVGTMSDPEDASTFNEFQVIKADDELTSDYQEFVVVFDNTVGEDLHIAFRHGGTPSWSRSIYIDNFLLEVMPDAPVLVVDPDSWEFNQTQVGATSFPKDFTISNEGVGTLSISPEDISISGDDAGRFILHNITETIHLEAFDSETISVEFAPEAVGLKEAVLEVKEFQAPVSGVAFDATITEFPHLEDFSDVEEPDLPLGWTKIVDNPDMSGAKVVTTSDDDPFSGPSHVQIHSNDYDNQSVMLISPPVENLEERRIRFRAKCDRTTNIPDLIIGTIGDPSNEDTFIAVDTIKADYLTDSYDSLFTVHFGPVKGEAQFVAFRHGSSPSFNRSLFLDDILIESIPDEPLLVVIPAEEVDFGLQQIGTSSEPQQFVLYNDGGGTLSIGPDDISITGLDADDFVLNNLSETVFLEFGESADISVAFSPEEVGEKQATLEAKEANILLTGDAQDATITETPHFEDFSGAEPPAFPFGWNKIVHNPGFGSATVETTTSNSPESDPNHARLYSNDNEEQDVMLISPPVEDLHLMRISFLVKCNSATNVPDLIVGSMSDPFDADTFNPVDTIPAESITTSYDESFTVNFVSAVGNDMFIGLRHGGTPNWGRSLFIDNFLLETIPDEPILVVTPDGFDFGMQQTGTTSSAQAFTILNDGGGTLTVGPDDISITGTDAGDFVLSNLAEPQDLQAGETAEISVAFAPEEIGNKTANLQILDESIAITGEAFDATVTEFPWEEGFEADWVGEPQAPMGWTYVDGNVGSYWEQSSVQSNTGDYSARSYNGSASNYLADEWLITPPIDLDELDEAMLYFFGYSNRSPDGVKENMRILILDQTYDNTTELHDNASLLEVIPFSQDWEQYTVCLEDHSGTKHIAFNYYLTEDDNAGFNWIYIDDVLIDEAPETFEVTFTVTDDSAAENPLEGAAVEVNNMDPVFTGENGLAVIDLINGTYTAQVSKPGFEEAEVNFTVEDESLMLEVTLFQKVFALSLEASPEQGGTVSGEGDFEADQEVTILAEANDGYLFVNWTDSADEVVSTDAEYTFDMPWEDLLLVANFEEALHPVTFIVAEASPDEAVIEGALISINGYDDLFTDQNGQATIELEDGAYSAIVSKNGYVNEQVPFIVDGEEKSIEVLMTDIIEEPFNLDVVTEGLEEGEALFLWNLSDAVPFYEGFEGGTMPAEWDQVITNDNPSGPITSTWTVNDHSSEDYEPFGDYHAGLWWNPAHQDEWLISPEISIESGFELEFWSVVFLGSEHDDHYYVKVSTDGGDTWSVLWDASAQTGGWHYYEFPFVIDLDEYAGQDVRIAFNAVDGPANGGLWYIWFIDEVSVGPEDARSQLAINRFSRRSNAGNTASEDGEPFRIARDGSAVSNPGMPETIRAFTGYNVFLNGNLVAESIEETEYLFTDLSEGEHTAGVQSVYTTGSSDVVEIEFEIEPELYTVTFNVTDEDNEPIPDAIIIFDGEEHDAGEYVFTGVEPGNYTFNVSKEGYTGVSGTVAVVDGDVEVNVILEEEAPETYTVTFNVQDEEGEPLSGAVITFDGVAYDPGVYVIEKVEAGTYDYLVAKAGYHEEEGSVTVTEEDVQVTVVLEADDVFVGDPSKTGLTLYPNPVRNTLHVQSGEVIKEIRLIDMLGQVVYSAHGAGKEYQLNVSGFESGIYFVQIHTSGGFATQRLQITR